MADAKISTFSTIAANTATFTYAYVAANGAYGKIAINASGGIPVYTSTALTPYADVTNALGTNAMRWNGAVFGFTTAVAWSDGTHQNTQKYVDGTGPQFLDRTTGFKTTFNVQSQTADRAVTVPDRTGTMTVDGLPTADNANELGSSAFRWSNFRIGLAHAVLWDDGAGSTNRFLYSDGIGPSWHDRGTTENLTFNIQSITVSRTATWPDASGTVTLLGNTATGTGSVVLAAGPALTGVPTAPTAAAETNTTQVATTAFVFANAPFAVVTDPAPITPTAGASVSLTAYGAAAVWPIQPAGTLATLTVDIAAGSATDGGNLVFVAFTQIITAITWGSHISATHGLPLPSAIAANQTVGFVWISADSKWTRFL